MSFNFISTSGFYNLYICLKQLATLHDKNRDGNIDYNDFIAAKKWVNKNFLQSAFEGKRKKKKGKKGGKKGGKFKLVMPICTQDEGPRMDGGAPPEIFIPHHIHFTDTGRFDRDHPPAHPLQVWILCPGFNSLIYLFSVFILSELCIICSFISLQ